MEVLAAPLHRIGRLHNPSLGCCTCFKQAHNTLVIIGFWALRTWKVHVPVTQWYLGYSLECILDRAD
eukprot:1092664-Pelagomonas_calceolata.AAC.4